jgi:hypothetical protein
MNPELSQPSGSINYNNILLIKNNKRYTTFEFEIEKISNNNFGNNFRFSPLNDFCHNSFEKNITINCLKNIQINGGVFMKIVSVLRDINLIIL